MMKTLSNVNKMNNRTNSHSRMNKNTLTNTNMDIYSNQGARMYN